MAQSIEQQLKKILRDNFVLDNGKTIRQNLEGAVRYLYDCVDNFIQEYYLSYRPKEYKRTYDFQDSLYAEDFIHAKVINNRIVLQVSFIPSMAYHWNLWNDHKSYVPMLINFGWRADKLEQRIGKVERFTRYDGYHIIEKAVRMFNARNPYGVYIALTDIEYEWEGESFQWGNYY